MMMANRKLKVRKIVFITGTLYGSVFSILSNHFDMRNQSAIWVTHLLTINRNRLRVISSKKYVDSAQQSTKQTAEETMSFSLQIGATVGQGRSVTNKVW